MSAKALDKYRNHLETNHSTIPSLVLPGQKQTPALMSSQITLLTMHLTAVILLTSYSAYLVSFIATRVSELPFNSFEEFLKAGTHHLAVEPYSSHTMYFKVPFVFISFLLSFSSSPPHHHHHHNHQK
jgi:hypothetical protein